jgi:hypothetical protein
VNIRAAFLIDGRRRVGLVKTVHVAAETELRRIACVALLAMSGLSFVVALALGDGLGNAAQRFGFTAVLLTLLGIVVAPIAARRRRGRMIDALPSSAIVVSGTNAVVNEWRTGIELCVLFLIWVVPASTSMANFAGLMFAGALIYVGLGFLPGVKAEARERTVYRQLGSWGPRSTFAVDVRPVATSPAPIAADA